MGPPVLIQLPQQNPFWRDFLVSAGFGGVAALVAAILAASAAIYTTRRTVQQQDRLHREKQDEERRSQAITRCWDRLLWVVKSYGADTTTSDTESASLGLGPELVDEVLEMLEHDAQDLKDLTLERAVNAYLTQFALVLAAQTGRHARVSGHRPE